MLKFLNRLLLIFALCLPCQAAIEFDGNDDYISVANSSELDVTGAYTTTAWINIDAVVNYQLIFWRGAVAASEIEFYGRSTDTVILHNRPGSGGTFTYKTCPALSTGWHFFAVSYGGNASTWKIYYDNVEQSCSLTSGSGQNPADNNAGWKIGQGGSAFGNEEFLGEMDDIRIYNRALSATEIDMLYNSRQKRIPGTLLENGLVLHFENDQEAVGTAVGTVTDVSGNDNHGTGNGGSSLQYTGGILRR